MPPRRIKFYHSIRFRLSAIIAGVILSAVIALSAFNASQSLERETENFRALTAGAATAYAAAVADDVAARNRMQTLSALRGIRDLPNVSQTDITFPNGEVFVELGSGAWLIGDAGEERSLWTVDQVRIQIPVIKSGEQIAELGMLADIRPLRSEILNSLYITIASACLIALIGILLAQVFVVRLTSPLRTLTQEMANIRDGHTLKAVELKDRKDETGLLTQTFSDMIGAIRDRDDQIAEHMNTLEETVEIRTKDLRLARDEAEAANAAKSDFLATMSHEIRTPMNGMMVMAEMLGAADLTPRHKRYAEIIHRSGNSLLTIINDILDLSKIEAGQLDLEIIPTSPEGLVTDIASLFWERARGKGLELATYVSPNVPDEVFADPTRLNQVISNLVNNALKFTEQGGVLIRVDAESAGSETDTLTFEVIDTGIGIPEDKIDHIFESFSQADQSTTRKFGGTGLGLTVCQRLVTAMEGDISVSSTPGKGSTFKVTFDAKVSKPAARTKSNPINVGIDLPDGVLKIALTQSMKDAGGVINNDQADLWVVTSASFTDRDAPSVLLTDIGDTQADNLLKSGQAKDVLPNPFKRADLSALLSRAHDKAYRGIDALSSSGETSSIESFEGLRILAVDDNAVNREVLREALITLKAEATFAEDGAQAVELFEQNAFDLVLMDGSMPVMDGFEATRQIRAHEEAKGAPRTAVFALTAQVVGSDETAWDDAGADGHILKPFTLQKLASVFSEVEVHDAAQEGSPAPETPEPETASESMLDLATVQSLEQLGGAPGAVRDRVWSMFFDKAPDMLSELQNLVANGAAEDVAQKAHAFKSMALSSGFKGLADCLQSIEVSAKAGARNETLSSDADQLIHLLELTSKHAATHEQQAA